MKKVSYEQAGNNKFVFTKRRRLMNSSWWVKKRKLYLNKNKWEWNIQEIPKFLIVDKQGTEMT